MVKRGNEMNVNVMKKYLKNIYRLESSLYEQNLLYNKINAQINGLKNQPEEALYEENQKQKESITDILGGIAGFGLLGAAALIIIRGVYSFFAYAGGIIADLFTGRLWDWLTQLALIGALIGVGISIVIIIWDIISTKYRLNKENEEIRLLNAEIMEKNRRNNYYISQKIVILNKEKDRLLAVYRETKNTLNEYYSYNIIFPKYRHLEAISSFCEYFSSGRCISLEGHEGAYNIYANELIQGIIINKLDNIIEHLDRIEDNQYMLYSAIKEGNEQSAYIASQINNTANLLAKIESNSDVTAYYSKISAQNTECLKWMKIFDRR